MEEKDFQADKYAAFMAKLETLRKAYAENTIQTKKLIRILRAAGFQDPEDMARAAEKGLQVPSVRRSPSGDVWGAVANHLMQAFPPEDMRGMAEEFLDAFTRKGRRRR